MQGANAASGLDQYLEYAPYDPFPNAPDSIPGKANSVKSVTPFAPAADGNRKAMQYVTFADEDVGYEIDLPLVRASYYYYLLFVLYPVFDVIPHRLGVTA